MISAGRLRHSATGYRAAARSALNEPKTWQAITGPMRCDFREESQTQGEQAGGAVTVLRAEVRFRWSTWNAAGLRPTDRLLINANGTTRTVSIEGVVNLDQANRVAVVSVAEVSL
jgi:hypothetical protein